ncbi:hypothetical protein [Rickettsiella endosymbiont of Litargus connexus]|jgi:hypothetical protein|uniref:hypothetical protein n=1 Tax=Rickettsiella endosymbiont of Litargus connexus TaxID=3066237 RepID=UPI00376F037D
MEEVHAITNTEDENRSVLHNLALPISYSLSKELHDNSAELLLLEKKIILGNNLLAKVNDQALILKLKKERRKFQEKKTELTTLIEKLKFIIGSIKDFTLFFIFIGRFYTLTIEKLNFEQRAKKISLKLIYDLKKEEQNLYNEYVEGDCFTKVLEVLSFESYQCYFQEYTKNFFGNIPNYSDRYVNALLIIKAMFSMCASFRVDQFDLTNVKIFLSNHIPHAVALPNHNYELVALRCFFFYEIVKEYLKLKLVKNNLSNLKKSISLELNIINYKSQNKKVLIMGLYNLQESLSKIEEKYSNFLKKKPEDNESDINESLAFFKIIVDDIQLLNTKTKNLIQDKYAKLNKMCNLLVIITHENYLPKFLEVFNIKIGNDFLLNEIKGSENIETNKEALNHLFHAICRDEFYIPLSKRVNLFINQMTETYCKADISVLESIELEDLIEFSFYYIFTLAYMNFNDRLKGTNTKLLYAQMVAFNRFINIKFESLEVLEKRKNEKISKFLEKNFKNKENYFHHKENILEEIKLNLEMIQNIKSILSDAKSLETALIPKLESDLIPMPEANTLINFLKKLEKKQKTCEAEYQKIEKHLFFDKSKTKKIIKKSNEVYSEKDKGVEENKMIEFFSEPLIYLSRNLMEILKNINIKENLQDINQFCQKLSSAMGQLSSSINKLILSMGKWNYIYKTHHLTDLSLPELLKLIDEIIIKEALTKSRGHKKKLFQLKELLNTSCLSTELLIDQVNPIINKYHNLNTEAKKFLSMLPVSFIDDHKNFKLLSKSMIKKVKRNIKEYKQLKEQSNCLVKLIRLIKCEMDDRAIRLYAIIVEADDYQRTYKFFEKLSSKTFNHSKQILSVVKQRSSEDTDKKVALPQPSQLMNATKEITIESLGEAQVESNYTANGNRELELNEDLLNNQEPLNVEKKLIEEEIFIDASLNNRSNNSGLPDMTLLQDYEAWNFEFEKWKNDKNAQLYKLFHIIENCSKTVLMSSANAFLKYLSLHQNDLIEKNDELNKRKNQISSFFNDPAKNKLFISYLTQYLNWFDEIFQRIIVCRTLILQNEQNPEIQESPRLPSSFANNRAEFNNLLTFYLGATDKYNKFRDNLINEEKELNNLNRNFIKQILSLGSLDEMEEDNVLSGFSKQLDRVNQLKLAIEQEFETKQKIKEKLSLIASPEIVKFYLSRIDPCDADSLKTVGSDLFPPQFPAIASCGPSTFYYLPPSAVGPIDGAQSYSQIFYTM